MLQDYKTQQPLVEETRQDAASQVKKEYAIEFEKVSRLYRLHHEPKATLQDWAVNLFKRKSSYEDFWALKDVSFKLEKGKTLGIIGRNGAGKSTLLKLATHVLSPTSGTIRVNGRVSAMLELGTGFHPDLSARDNIYLNGAFYGFSRKQMDERYEKIVEFSELGKFIDTPVKHFSSGMYMRLGFAIAITVEPDILIIDEVLAVGDAAFGRKCHQAIEELKKQSKAMLFVSHSAGEVSRFCDEVIYLSKGQIVAQGKPGDILDDYIVESMGPKYFTASLSSQTVPAPAPVPSAADSSGELEPPPTQNIESEAEILAPSEEIPVAESDIDETTTYQVSGGLSQPSPVWHFNMLQSQLENLKRIGISPEYYIAALNPQATPLNFELVVYKQSGPKGSPLRRISGGTYEVAAHQTRLLKLEDGALMNVHQLKLEAASPMVAELVEYKVGRIVSAGTLGRQLSPQWYFPFCDARFENKCYFELFNSGEQPLEIQLNLYSDSANVSMQKITYRCEPFSQLKIDLGKHLAEIGWEAQYGKPFSGGLLFEANLPFLIERHNLQKNSPRYQLVGGAD